MYFCPRSPAEPARHGGPTAEIVTDSCELEPTPRADDRRPGMDSRGGDQGASGGNHSRRRGPNRDTPSRASTKMGGE